MLFVVIDVAATNNTAAVSVAGVAIVAVPFDVVNVATPYDVGGVAVFLAVAADVVVDDDDVALDATYVRLVVILSRQTDIYLYIYFPIQ